MPPSQLQQAEDDLEKYQPDDVPLQFVELLVVENISQRLRRVGNQVELTIQRRLPFLQFELIFQARVESAKLREFPESIRLVPDFGAPHHAVFYQEHFAEF